MQEKAQNQVEQSGKASQELETVKGKYEKLKEAYDKLQTESESKMKVVFQKHKRTNFALEKVREDFKKEKETNKEK